MRRQGDFKGGGMGSSPSRQAHVGFVTDEVRRLMGRGTTPTIWQSKKYLPYDSIRVDGRIIDIKVDTSLEDAVVVTSGKKPETVPHAAVSQCHDIVWLDDNGRAITEESK